MGQIEFLYFKLDRTNKFELGEKAKRYQVPWSGRESSGKDDKDQKGNNNCEDLESFETITL